MKNAKLNKTLILLITAVMFIVAGFSFMGINSAKASSKLDWLSGSASTTATLNEVKSSVDVTVVNNDTLSFDNKLCINNFEMKFSLNASITKVTLTLKTKGQFATDDSVENEIEIVNTEEKEYTLKLKVVNNQAKYELNSDGENDLINKVAGKLAATQFTFTFETNDTDGKFSLIYVDQNVGVENYKQDFENNGTTLVNNGTVTPLVFADADFISTGYAINGQIYSVDFETYSLLDESGSNCFVKPADGQEDIWVENVSSGYTQKIQFNRTDVDGEVSKSYVIGYKSTTIEAKEVKVINLSADETVPYYVDDEDALASYKLAVEKAAQTEIDGKTYSLSLGESFEIPSLKSLIKDNVTAYENLSTTVYYRTPEKSSTTSSLKIPTDAAGKYEFFVVFEDLAGNSIDEDDFYTIDKDNNSVITEGKLYKYVFSFTLQDDHPLSVEPPVSQGEGYVGTTYTATGFKFVGNNTKEYKLFYNADVNATEDSANWVEIKKVSSSDTAESLGINEDTFNRYKDVAFNGTLSFKPDEKGAYMITCTVYSTTKVRSESASSIIKVEKEATVVEPANHWLQDNVWSVVFLGVGTLCLIAIVVLIFIKPKDKKED